MKKTLKVCLTSLAAVLGAATFVGCSSNKDTDTSTDTATKTKIGLITLHDENSTYDKNFIDAMKAACKVKDVELVLRTGIPEGNECYEAAAELADAGCKGVFADSFGHEDYIISAAKEFTGVKFAHATGTKAHTENLDNYSNAFASIYEGRYLAGVAAGLKLKELHNGDTTADCKVGYVGAYTYAEVISGYTSWYLGVKSVMEKVKMEVTFTGSWYDEAAEKEGATTLMNNNCELISQHADSMGAPSACENHKPTAIPNVSYNGSTEANCPNSYVISSRINWQPYFEKFIDATLAGTKMDYDYTGSLTDGMVVVSTPGAAAATGTQTKLDEVAAKLKDGSLKVFDTSTFTVTKTDKLNVNATVDSEGHLTEYNANIDGSTTLTNVITTKDDKTYFDESTKRSAPYFDVQIDGITLLNTKF